MKNKHINLIFSILLGVLLFTSCNEDNFLDRYPKADPNPENFFVDASSARKAVNAAYNPWTRSADMYERDLVILFDAMTDDSYWRPARSASIQQERWDLKPTLGAINSYWTYAFRSINAANFAIVNIPNSTSSSFTEDMQAPYIAEARFLRGFSYMFLTSLFGDVPLLTRPVEGLDEFNQRRVAKDTIYQQIIADFQYAKDNLPTEQPDAPGAVTKATAAAYLAKAYLYMEDYANSETAGKDAVQIAESTGYHLVDDYLSIWDESNEGNPELLFYIGYIPDVDGYGQNMTVQRICRDLPPELVSIAGGAGWGYALPQRDLYDAFEEGDPRRGYTMYAPGDVYGKYNGAEPFTYTHKDYGSNGEINEWTTTYNSGDDVIYDYRWSPTGMNVRKMTSSLANLTNVRWSGQDVPIMRMSELYLNLAEALAEQGKEEALDWVDKVRARATVNMPPRTVGDGAIGDDNLVDIVRHERRVELAMEGVRLFDLLRWKTLGDVFGDGTKVKRHFYSDFLSEDEANSKYDAPALELPKNYLFPIPQDEIDQNSEINSNNPGYDQ
ncbi:RagB/SusD family nutrient uptake outer membrane protein [uncultured Sunxiuqinia sp.]|uniref:RagB/SusD family nutrient uptake outer membrane protein n=1 Tax=uncultured Sunxiuqinia sp. TaxID=1573825 RepID=UPI002AA82882|nr:RagB/SusD family nutrient uptake outer membrane protein [uncultured Sunxiuqinia sp.]